MHRCNGKESRMFDKFGEFDSCEELDRAAEAQRKEGDLEALKALAVENGIDPEDAEDYFDGCMYSILGEYNAMEQNAALGKLKVEKEELKVEREFQLLTEELETACCDYPEIAIGVRRKGKRLAEYLAMIIDAGYRNAVTPPKAILDKVTAVPSQYRSQIKTGMPSKAERKEIMRKYYVGEVVE